MIEVRPPTGRSTIQAVNTFRMGCAGNAIGEEECDRDDVTGEREDVGGVVTGHT